MIKEKNNLLKIESTRKMAKLKKQNNKYFVNNFHILCNFLKWKVNIFNYLMSMISDGEPKTLLHLNHPPNYKRDILF